MIKRLAFLDVPMQGLPVQILPMLLLISLLSCSSMANELPSSFRSTNAISSVEKSLKQELSNRGLEYGNPIFIRIFKKSKELEMWVKQGPIYTHFKTYPICTFSGGLGPKTKEGDRKSPEGFYFVNAQRLNPWSQYHLSFNLGYPNAYDRDHGYTGSALMIHGKCVSIGCYAMTDKYINEIYALAHAALKNGQPFFRVHAFPFRMERSTLNSYKRNKWMKFWENLAVGYHHFEQYKVPPNVIVQNGKYRFEQGN